MRRGLSSPVQWSLPRAEALTVVMSVCGLRSVTTRSVLLKNQKSGFSAGFGSQGGAGAKQRGPMVLVPAALLLLMPLLTSSGCICPPSSLSSSCIVGGN